jgi:hypothetical protein
VSAPAAAVTGTATPAGRRVSPFRRWWFWATVGAVAAAGAATFVLLSRSSYQKEGTLGTLGVAP